MQVLPGQPTLVCPCVGVHRGMLLMSSYLLPLHVLFVQLGLFCKMGDKQPYGCFFFVGVHLPGFVSAQSVGAVEYTNCISAMGLDSSNECSGYDIKPSDREAPVLKLREMWSTPSLQLLPGLL